MKKIFDHLRFYKIRSFFLFFNLKNPKFKFSGELYTILEKSGIRERKGAKIWGENGKFQKTNFFLNFFYKIQVLDNLDGAKCVFGAENFDNAEIAEVDPFDVGKSIINQ